MTKSTKRHLHSNNFQVLKNDQIEMYDNFEAEDLT